MCPILQVRLKATRWGRSVSCTDIRARQERCRNKVIFRVQASIPTGTIIGVWRALSRSICDSLKGFSHAQGKPL